MDRETPGIENRRNWWVQFKETLANVVPPIDSLSQQRAAEIIEKAGIMNASYFTDTASQNRIPHASYILKKSE